jgi:cell envelope opacity-associated protein A
LEVSLLYKFLDILETIEKGEANQHEASFKVGSILKEIYVDSALKKAQKLEKENELREKEKETERTPAKEPMKLSWRSYKIQTNKRIAELNDTHDMEMVD